MTSGSARSMPSQGPVLARRQGARGFSVLELVAVLALFGLISALLIGGSGALLRLIAPDDGQHTALTAISGARHSAVLLGRTLELHVDEKTRSIGWGEGHATLEGDDVVRLLPPVRTGAQLLGGQLVETPLARVRFYADGSCDPFRLETVRRGTSRILAIDPWTCAVLATEAAPGRR